MSDRDKASSIGRASDLLRSESLRIYEIAPAASSALESKESLSLSASRRSLPKSSSNEGGGSALYARGLQTEIGITSNGGSAALPEESLAFAAEAERGCELVSLETSAIDGNACPYTWTWVEGDEEDVPNLGALPQARWLFLKES